MDDVTSRRAPSATRSTIPTTPPSRPTDASSSRIPGSFADADRRHSSSSRPTAPRQRRRPRRPLAFANGSRLTRRSLWIIESAAPAVSAMALGGGELETRRSNWNAACPTAWPSTPHGGLLISCYQPNQLWRWTREAWAWTLHLRRVDRRVRSSRRLTSPSTARTSTASRWRRSAATTLVTHRAGSMPVPRFDVPEWSRRD